MVVLKFSYRIPERLAAVLYLANENDSKSTERSLPILRRRSRIIVVSLVVDYFNTELYRFRLTSILENIPVSYPSHTALRRGAINENKKKKKKIK